MIDKKSAIILDGKKLAEEILLQLQTKITNDGLKPGLAAILIGDDPASEIYVRLKEKAAQRVGITFHKYLSNKSCYQEIDEYELKEMLRFLNQDPATDGIVLQLPLPKRFNQSEIIKLISPKKDADGFNGGAIIPPTVASAIELLKSINKDLSEKKTLVIAKSDIFTNGMENWLDSELKIKNIKQETSIPADSNTYDIIIIALGQPLILKKEQVKKSAIVIDIGINKLNDKTVGDVDPVVAEVADYLSPVPGGVGPLTVACLLRNTVELHQNNRLIN
jgi:methylenetetrahydrofolate dehydrogenase (NADP+) / methenyltetrahydrofolate cyclohydrolase